MSRVLIFGASPLPIENERKISGPGIRTWQFVKPLVDDKHTVCLISLREDKGCFHDRNDSSSTGLGFDHLSMTLDKFTNIDVIRETALGFNPDCIVSISSFPASQIAAGIGISKPIWFDRGDLMAEAQLRAFISKDDSILKSYYDLEKTVLSCGDVFSSVSFPQKCSVIGGLGIAGRLNSLTLGYEFVHVIPCGIDPAVRFLKTGPVLRGKILAKDDFAVLWSGGYNSWADVDTLFNGVESAMSKNRHIKFVSTGGAIEGQDDFNYNRLLEMVHKSLYKDRFCMLGWVPHNDLVSIYRECDLGLNIDRQCYETLLGSRHRLLDWMQAGLAFVTTTPSEFTRMLCARGLAFGVEAGNSAALKERILRQCRFKPLQKLFSCRLKKFVEQNYSYADTALPLRQWAANPTFSPDKRSHAGILDKVIGFADKEIITVRDELKHMQVHVDNLRKCLANMTAHADNLQNINSNLMSQIKTFDATMVDLNRHCSNLENIRTDLLNHSSNLQGQLDAMSKHAENLKAQRDQICRQFGLRYGPSGELEKETGNGT